MKPKPKTVRVKAWPKLREELDDLLNPLLNHYDGETDDWVARYEALLDHRFREGYKEGVEATIERLFTVEKEKWSDAVHCSCLGYALVELSGGEGSEGGEKMEKRLVALRELGDNNK